MAASDGTGLLSQDVLEVRRVQWRYSDLRKAPRGLTRIDHLQADHAAIGEWDEDIGEGEPIAYREEVTGQDTMILQTYPKPDDNGFLGVGPKYLLGFPAFFSDAVFGIAGRNNAASALHGWRVIQGHYIPLNNEYKNKGI